MDSRQDTCFRSLNSRIVQIGNDLRYGTEYEAHIAYLSLGRRRPVAWAPSSARRPATVENPSGLFWRAVGSLASFGISRVYDGAFCWSSHRSSLSRESALVRMDRSEIVVWKRTPLDCLSLECFLFEKEGYVEHAGEYPSAQHAKIWPSMLRTLPPLEASAATAQEAYARLAADMYAATNPGDPRPGALANAPLQRVIVFLSKKKQKTDQVSRGPFQPRLLRVGHFSRETELSVVDSSQSTLSVSTFLFFSQFKSHLCSSKFTFNFGKQAPVAMLREAYEASAISAVGTLCGAGTSKREFGTLIFFAI